MKKHSMFFFFRIVSAAVCILVLGACSLVVFDEDAVRGYRATDGMRERATIRLDLWDQFEDDADGDGDLVVPEAFFPDDRTQVSGLLVTREDDELFIYRVERSGFPAIGAMEPKSRERFRVDGTLPRRGFRWSVQVVPSGVEEDEPIVVLAVVPSTQSALGVDAYAVTEEDDDRLRVRRLDSDRLRAMFAASGIALSEPRILAAHSVPLVGDPDVGAELQLLVWDDVAGGPGNELREFFVRLQGIHLIEGRWNRMSIREGSTILWPVLTEGPNVPSGTLVPRAFYGSATLSEPDNPGDPVERRSYLSFADGLHSSAPLRTITWRTGEPEPPQELDRQLPIVQMDSGGVFRTASSGTVTFVDSRTENGPRFSRKEYGTLRYLGEYPAGTEEDPRLHGMYSAIGRVHTALGWVIVITIYEDD